MARTGTFRLGTGVRIEALAPDRVGISDAGGGAAPDAYKLTVAFEGGFVAEAGISYAGPGAQARAELAGRIVAERMLAVHASNAPLRVDVIGGASLHATTRRYHDDAMDVRLHCAQRASSLEQAELLLWEVESLLCCGPAGGGGYRGSATPSVLTYSASMAREKVTARTEILVAWAAVWLFGRSRMRIRATRETVRTCACSFTIATTTPLLLRN